MLIASREREILSNQEKIKANSCHRKVKCELNHGLVMINLYVKFGMFSVHSVNVIQVIVLRVADRRLHECLSYAGEEPN